MSLGLSLSGGGSRAMAFHRGTLKGLYEVGLLDKIDVVSTVSGGSIFGSAYLSSLKMGEKIDNFLKMVGDELKRGFEKRSINVRAIKMFLPGLTRSNVLADIFNEIFLRGFLLSDLPDRPKLCINVSLLNNGQLGKFSKSYFKCSGIVSPEKGNSYSEPVDLEEYPLALAATASAAFPGLLPPIYLKRGNEIPEGWGKGELKRHKRFVLVDGGVLDNLGIQSLLSEKSGFSCWDLIVSDAGTKEESWKPKGFFPKIASSLLGSVGIGSGFLSVPDLIRTAFIMQSKETREMRHNIFQEQITSWLEEEILSEKPSQAARRFCRLELERASGNQRRKVLFVSVNRDWDEAIRKIPEWRLEELKEKVGESRLPERRDTGGIEDFLKTAGVNLDTARCYYEKMGGKNGIERANSVGTHFRAIDSDCLDALYYHSLWQIHLLYQIYWK